MKKTHTCMNCGASLTAGEALNHTQVVICKPSSSSSDTALLQAIEYLLSDEGKKKIIELVKKLKP